MSNVLNEVLRKKMETRICRAKAKELLSRNLSSLANDLSEGYYFPAPYDCSDSELISRYEYEVGREFALDDNLREAYAEL